MGIGPSDPERAYASPTRSAVRYPRNALGTCYERCAREIELRVGTNEIDERRYCRDSLMPARS